MVGADRIAANGDVANKIGTYGVALLADAHQVPFTVAAPWSTIDLACPNGDAIPIEQRGRDEVAKVGDTTLTRMSGAYSTAAALVRAIIPAFAAE